MMQAVADDPRAVPGMVISIQSYGDQTANGHPHSHAIVTDGVFRPDGSFQPWPPLDPQQLLLLFRHKLLQELLRLEKIYPATIEILDRFRHTGFSAFQGPPVLPGDTAAREKLAVYIARAPLSLDRLSYDGPNGTVDYRPKASPSHPLLADDAPHQDPLEVLAALTDHVPNKGQQLVRYLGWYSNKSRGLRNKATPAASGSAVENISVAMDAAGPTAKSISTAEYGAVPLENPLPIAAQEAEDAPYRKACRRTWARLIEKVYLVSPLVCPKCQFPMKIVAFIEDQTVVRKILQHLGIWETPPRPPPKKIVPSLPAEPMEVDRLPWVADPMYSHDDPDPVYPD